MSKKAKKTRYKKDAYATAYTKEDIKTMVEKLEAIILDKVTWIKLVEEKERARKEVRLAESAVSKQCIANWKETIAECRKQIKKVKAKAK